MREKPAQLFISVKDVRTALNLFYLLKARLTNAALFYLIIH